MYDVRGQTEVESFRAVTFNINRFPGGGAVIKMVGGLDDENCPVTCVVYDQIYRIKRGPAQSS